jgi:hypothetical protein
MTNWATLNADIARIADRDIGTDDEFAASMPRFIANAEKRIYDECPFTLFNQQVDGALTAGSPFLPRPAAMKRSGSLVVGSVGQGSRQIYARTRAYIADFWPDQARTVVNKPPRYWAAYDATTLIVAPTPSVAVAYRLTFQGALPGLSANNQTNPLTADHYDVLLAAALVEAFRYSHEDQSAMLGERYEAQYQQLKAAAIANDLGVSISDAVPAEPRTSGA